ncbi:hypothetical protein [Paenibacillus sedimenti]|uniref:Uncharacterized protein n=1 Tax=Paenibacillus sedimenti TaxID=2770274 RepID=A0A926QKV8_9BACL|nr:hypothetical protein [Paenibacillus sedimenti]MBD0382198.1 hypothetical protein [Paenibacillus sedimenti]
MKKRRSTVLVSPGKDVTLYIPTDTRPEVIDYMNQLKADGMFSHGIMDILTRYILQDRAITALSERDAMANDSGSYLDETAVDLTGSFEDQGDHESIVEPAAISQNNFSLDQIFRQAGRNAGKLLNDIEN